MAAIDGLEDSGKTHALVLERVGGETLADRIARDQYRSACDAALERRFQFSSGRRPRDGADHVVDIRDEHPVLTHVALPHGADD